MNILLIEDSDLVARSLTRLFKRKGHDVTHVVGVGDVLDYIMKGGKPDVVVTDREVVGGDAWEFVLHAVKKDHLPDRVVFMSARPPDVIPPCFFQKGDDIETLVKLVEES